MLPCSLEQHVLEAVPKTSRQQFLVSEQRLRLEVEILTFETCICRWMMLSAVAASWQLVRNCQESSL